MCLWAKWRDTGVSDGQRPGELAGAATDQRQHRLRRVGGEVAAFLGDVDPATLVDSHEVRDEIARETRGELLAVGGANHVDR